MTENTKILESVLTSMQERRQNVSTGNQKNQEIDSIHIRYSGDRLNLGDILDSAIDYGTSDIHFSGGEKIAFRINGDIRFAENVPKLTNEQAEQLIFTFIQNEREKEMLLRTRELDIAYEHVDGTLFRVNIFFKCGNIATVCRLISREAFSMDGLGLPPAIEDVLKLRHGLILVTGPTGSGKSTSVQSIVEHINDNRVEHILTIEDPVEFVFESRKSIISQREVGKDTLSYANALKASLREDPDVIVIGEMRDAETIAIALNLAETGHLVISTLHTSSASKTVNRIINLFPSNQQKKVQERVADLLACVLSQRLLPRQDQEGRIALFELMIANNAIRNLVRNGDFVQLDNAIQSGRNEGMITMESHAAFLLERGIISEKDVARILNHG